ncbi:putative TIM-barrel fold metal-dependent hydrolase [Saccharomonospora marina XMU15]|uniref:Putative TIM-barrel fold metal-dependent hydrolase n=1 Tax=Saccharomonospora marina XMU15 TaxID=882083 RepID=H5X3V6_9PSEU|nr:amidohydrolase [Saccharomonospora marina]EHR52174.1 putative TIM-barrel fold metal-dependent hydrolase [Saccharomonospora marina XMU15]
MTARPKNVRRRRFLQGIGAGVALGALGGTAEAAARPGIGHAKADLLLYNGSVLTLHGAFVPAAAIAVKDGVVQAVGRTRELRRLVGSRTEVVNLRGRTVMPGVNDGHFHPLSLGTGQPPLTLDLSRGAVGSIAEIRDLVAEAARDKGPGVWIRGFGWDQGYLAEGRYPTRHDIDAVSADNPAALREWSGHALWVNSKALELAGITRDTQPPLGGEIVKDADGEPTGLLLEGAAGLVNAVMPDFTEEEKRQGLRMAVDIMHQHGITSVTDAGIELGSVQRYQEMLESGDIRQRCTIMIAASRAGDLRQTLLAARGLRTDPRWLNVSQVKIFADGVPTQARTAWVCEPYVGGGHGGLTLPGNSVEEQLSILGDWVMTAHELGFQVGAHATGDRTIHAVIDAYAAAVERFGGAGLRHYVIHGDLTSPADLRRMARLGFAASFNPQIKRSLSHQLVDVLGRERTNYQWPYRTALSSGVSVASASDSPVVGMPNFCEGLTAMLTRRSLATGEVFGAEEIIGLRQALATYTTAGAWQDHAEDWKGSLTRGRVADLVVVGGNLLRTPAEEIVNLPIDMTVVGGEVVYDAATHKRVRTASAAAASSGLARYLSTGCCHG